ncbi:hypothetical protein FB451DRAFT_1509732 [Mycena latifolia]|nr:hypothetical protein FB451DRAFT_1509732 [Mycena latifolia]
MYINHRSDGYMRLVPYKQLLQVFSRPTLAIRRARARTTSRTYSCGIRTSTEKHQGPGVQTGTQAERIDLPRILRITSSVGLETGVEEGCSETANIRDRGRGSFEIRTVIVELGVAGRLYTGVLDIVLRRGWPHRQNREEEAAGFSQKEQEPTSKFAQKEPGMSDPEARSFRQKEEEPTSGNLAKRKFAQKEAWRCGLLRRKRQNQFRRRIMGLSIKRRGGGGGGGVYYCRAENGLKFGHVLIDVVRTYRSSWDKYNSGGSGCDKHRRYYICDPLCWDAIVSDDNGPSGNSVAHTDFDWGHEKKSTIRENLTTHRWTKESSPRDDRFSPELKTFVSNFLCAQAHGGVLARAVTFFYHVSDECWEERLRKDSDHGRL